MVCRGLSTIQGFRYPLGVLDTFPKNKGETTLLRKGAGTGVVSQWWSACITCVRP